MRVRRALLPMLGMLALVATACPETPGTGGGTSTTVTTTSTTSTTLADGDNDGYTTGSDCNDSDPAINPGVTVDTLGDGVDSNCDGQDGIASNVVFVSAASTDTSTCGDISAPCKTINQGLTRAAALTRTQVQVAEGSYPKFNVAAGLEIGGHYKASTWSKVGAGDSVVNAAFDASVGGPVGIVADGITTATKVADLKVAGTTAAAGQASYGIVIRNSTSALVLNTIVVNGGTGGNGTNGANGVAASQTAPGAAANGGNGFEPTGTYNNTSAGGGGAGAGGGGTGGKGGVVDRDTCLFCNYDAQPGQTGAAGASGGGTGGTGGLPDTGTLIGGCQNNGLPTPGLAGGAGANGSTGNNGLGGSASVGTITAGAWARVPASTGAAGAAGTAGKAGGGGGGGGASDCQEDDAGAGGGGGGAPGAASLTGGAAGSGGLAAIGILLVNSNPTMTGVSITLGTGGNGGNGGIGAAGQPGGNGGNGGGAFEDGGAGGNGGKGGNGGASGNGGAGAGGPSLGLVLNGASTGSATYSGGQGGTGSNTGPVSNTVTL